MNARLVPTMPEANSTGPTQWPCSNSPAPNPCPVSALPYRTPPMRPAFHWRRGPMNARLVPTMPEANRTGPTQRRTSIALAFVLLAIAALVALPWAGALRSRPLYDELTDVLSPARELVSRIQVALALEGSLLRDYLASRDASLTARYRDAVRQELSATDSLAALVATLGPDPRAQLAEFRREQ